MTTAKKSSIQELLENARLLGYKKIYPKNKLPGWKKYSFLNPKEDKTK